MKLKGDHFHEDTNLVLLILLATLGGQQRCVQLKIETNRARSISSQNERIVLKPSTMASDLASA